MPRRPFGGRGGRRPRVPELDMRDKRAAFRRLAQNRTNATLDMIRKLENLSNRGNYDYTESEIAKIFDTLRTALNEAEGKFARGARGRSPFEL